jgi:hypothetical protein
MILSGSPVAGAEVSLVGSVVVDEDASSSSSLPQAPRKTKRAPPIASADRLRRLMVVLPSVLVPPTQRDGFVVNVSSRPKVSAWAEVSDRELGTDIVESQAYDKGFSRPRPK